jgi:hypothetical protein
VIDSPFILAGIVIVIVAIVGGIAASLLRTRAENSFTTPARGDYTYEPLDATESSTADLSKLDALVGHAPTSVMDHTPALEGEPLDVDDDPLAQYIETPPEKAEPAPVTPPLLPETEAPPIAPSAPAPDIDALPPVVLDEPERSEDEPLPALWAHLVATEDGPLNVQDRLDMVARLEMVGEKWCVDALESATREEQDPQVNAAVRAALARLTR